MANVKVKVTEGFYDRTADLAFRKKNSTLTVSEERAKKLEGLGLAKRIREEEKKDEEKKG